MDINIKPEYKQTVIAAGNSGLPLGRKTKDEILDIAILARQSNDTTLLCMFKNLPKLEELQKEKTDKQLRKLNVSKPGTPVKEVEIPNSFTGSEPKELLKRPNI